MDMPDWFQRQLRKAFLQQDRYRIRLLNECWFYYQKNSSERKLPSTRLSKNK